VLGRLQSANTVGKEISGAAHPPRCWGPKPSGSFSQQPGRDRSRRASLRQLAVRNRDRPTPGRRHQGAYRAAARWAVTCSRCWTHQSDPSAAGAEHPPFRHVAACAGRQSVHPTCGLSSSAQYALMARPHSWNRAATDIRARTIATRNRSRRSAKASHRDHACIEGPAVARLRQSAAGRHCPHCQNANTLAHKAAPGHRRRSSGSLLRG
jgi:hypothetical protein